MKEIVWLKNGRILSQINNSVKVLDALPKRVYTMNYDEMKHEIFLEEFDDAFHFDYKIYGIESKLITHIMKTFNNTTSNLGILFNGTKGTGKTLTAKIIANKTNLPVILINAPYSDLSNFISKIQCPVVLFFDEFEKNFDTNQGEDKELLSIMDGVYNSPYRRVFLLTTNKLYINDNFIGRPSRIRYRKYFGNLSPEVIIEYLDDNLLYKDRKKEIIDFIDSLTISTIDILKSIVEEVNIHNCPISEFKSFINVESAKYRYSALVAYYDIDGTDKLSTFKSELNRVGKIEKKDDGESFKVDLDYFEIEEQIVSLNTPIEFKNIGDELSGWGTVVKPLDKDGFLVAEDDDSVVCFKFDNLNIKPSLYKGIL